MKTELDIYERTKEGRERLQCYDLSNTELTASEIFRKVYEEFKEYEVIETHSNDLKKLDIIQISTSPIHDDSVSNPIALPTLNTMYYAELKEDLLRYVEDLIQ